MCYFQNRYGVSFKNEGKTDMTLPFRHERILEKYEKAREFQIKELKRGTTDNVEILYLINEYNNSLTQKETSKSEYKKLSYNIKNIKENAVLPKKSKCFIFKPLKRIDSFFEKTIRSAFGFTCEKKGNKKIYSMSSQNISLKKIVTVFTPPILLYLLGFMFLYSIYFVHIIFSLIIMSSLISTYVFIKALKYIWLLLKKRKTRRQKVLKII